METPLLRLYPTPALERPLRGTYFAHDVRRFGSRERPYYYANFVTSLDGRISQIDRELGRFRPPRAIANPRDWRLHLELVAQADAAITSSSRLAALLEAGRPEIRCTEQMEDPVFAAWRRQHGLASRPSCIVLCRDIEFPVEQLLAVPHDDLIVMAGSAADRKAVQRLKAGGIEVRLVAQRWVIGRDVDALAAERGFRAIYVTGGPDVLYTLLDAQRLGRLYLTHAHLALGGRDYDTLVRGDALLPPAGFRLHELYLDPAEADKPEITFASYNLAAEQA